MMNCNNYFKFIILVTFFLGIQGCNKIEVNNFVYNVESQISLAREISTGNIIDSSKYAEEPTVLKLRNNSWACFFAKSDTGEGCLDTKVLMSTSNNKGHTWSHGNPIDSAGTFTPVACVNSFGRIFLFYVFNDSISFLNQYNFYSYGYVGALCYKYSDDNGTTWSQREYIQVPLSVIYYPRKLKGYNQQWVIVSKPIIVNNQLYFSLTKFDPILGSSGWVLNCNNINTETDNSKLSWTFLPDNITCIYSPTMGMVQEEHNIVGLNSGAFCCVFRTTLGYPGISYSNGNCNAWSQPMPMEYSYGDTIRNPRACAKIFKCSNGKYLLWFHNNSNQGYTNRNPVWICGGVELNGSINWSQPEILVYKNKLPLNHSNSISYPDMIEDCGQYYFFEGDKSSIRINQANAELINNLWNQNSNNTASKGDAEFLSSTQIPTDNSKFISYINNTLQTGLCLEFSYLNNSNSQLLFSVFSNNKVDSSINIWATNDGNFRIDIFSNKKVVTSYYCDKRWMKSGQRNLVAFNFDFATNVVSAVVNGVLCNANANVKTGWSFTTANLNYQNVYYLNFNNNSSSMNFLKVFGNYLTTTQMVWDYNYITNH